jgi:hypothetical protein
MTVGFGSAAEITAATVKFGTSKKFRVPIEFGNCLKARSQPGCGCCIDVIDRLAAMSGISGLVRPWITSRT